MSTPLEHRDAAAVASPFLASPVMHKCAHLLLAPPVLICSLSLLLLHCCWLAYHLLCRNCSVKICKGCNAFRSKALGENEAEAAAAAAAEEEEAAGRPGETVLSYDSDELE